MFNKVLGSALIVAGTAIGAGMLGMPFKSAGLGFGMTSAVLLFIWVISMYSALLFVEIYQFNSHTIGLVDLSKRYFGNVGKIIMSILMFLFSYAIITLYIKIAGDVFDSYLHLGPSLSAIAFTLMVTAIIALGTYFIDQINKFVVIIMAVAFITILILFLPKVEFSNLTAVPVDNMLVFSAATIFFTSFGFHVIIPSLNNYLDGKVKYLRLAILIGSSIPLFVYILWQLSLHGILPQEQFLAISQKDNVTIKDLAAAVSQSNQYFGTAINAFTFFAILSSFFGVALGLITTIKDLLSNKIEHALGNITYKNDSKNAKQTQIGKILVTLIAFAPPIFVILINQDSIFLKALSVISFLFALISIIFPAAVVYKLRTKPEYAKLYTKDSYRTSGGLISVFIFGVVGAVLSFSDFL